MHVIEDGGQLSALDEEEIEEGQIGLIHEILGLLNGKGRNLVKVAILLIEDIESLLNSRLIEFIVANDFIEGLVFEELDQEREEGVEGLQKGPYALVCKLSILIVENVFQLVEVLSGIIAVLIDFGRVQGGGLIQEHHVEVEGS